MLTPDIGCAASDCSGCGAHLTVNDTGITYTGMRALPSMLLCPTCAQVLLRSLAIDLAAAMARAPGAPLWTSHLVGWRRAALADALTAIAAHVHEADTPFARHGSDAGG